MDNQQEWAELHGYPTGSQEPDLPTEKDLAFFDNTTRKVIEAKRQGKI